jgi:hypothetical protein
MHLECHAALGWLIANAGTADRKIRNYTVISAILPDIDALPYLISPLYYGLYHHTFGHNVFLWLLWSAWGVKRFHSWRAGLLGFIAFGSHLLTDAYLSNWLLYLLWPFSKKGFLPANSLELGSPVNTWLLYSTPLWLLVAALIWKRTPLEWISPKLDHLFISFFRAKPAHCYLCERGANLQCETCLQPICPKHLHVRSKWKITCATCRRSQTVLDPATK